MTQPTIEVEHITVPELDDEMFDNTSASSFSSTSNLMLDKVLELGEEEEEEEEANEKAKKSSRGKNKAKKSAGEEEKPIELKEKKKKKKRVNPQEKYSFANQMAEKMEKLNELPRNEKRPVPDDIIKTVVATFKLNVKPGTAPKITIPDDYKDDDETGISEFEIPNEPYTQSLFNTNIKIEHNEIRTINSNYNIKDTFKSLPENVQEQLKKVGVKPVDKKMNDFERIFENIEKLSGDELPAFATGVFLNGRMHSCADLAKSLLNIRFSCHKIREIFSDLHVTDKKGYLAFFYQLYSENLTSMFFKAILNMPSFRIANYFPDALMREDKTCIILANNARKATKQIKSPTIPFKLETAPRLLLFGSIPIFQQNQTEQWISANNERQLATPFSMIIASLIELIAKTYSDKDCKSILYHGEYGIIWNKLFQLREMFTDSFEEHFYIKRKAHRNEKVTEVLIYALVENRIIDLLAHFIDEENPSSNVISEFVLCISELLKLKQSFVPDCMNDPNIFHQVTADLDKIFTRDPPRKKKAPVKQKSALEKIVDEAKETTVNIVNEAASKANEVVAKAGDAVAVLNDQVQKTVA
ncbi:hypothetical protein TRFO_17754 [Tritrichomonas foetus]|uniref:Uncharacterized protein n=1 Tax=Tritrichomonas foetus TaxID=1144522 RepID=A0A1J4KM49_9EUKA|nr:hypothetical protein TRFO_17754 [Tritrichomonas foetus]|eukprot:OHT12391.1 hypothetical protein TRFO_17754 [Tritrichomonas foetus]